MTWVIRKFMGGTAQLLSCSFVTKNASENVRKVPRSGLGLGLGLDARKVPTLTRI